MSLFIYANQAFEAIAEFPAWLASFDALNIPGWAVLAALSIAVVGLVFAIREFLSWFLKTNSIIDEVVRLETLVRDMQGDLAALEATVEKLQTTTGSKSSLKMSDDAAPLQTPKPQFRLNHGPTP